MVAAKNASGGALSLYGLVFIVVGGLGLLSVVRGRAWPNNKRLSRIGNGVSSVVLLAVGIVMVLVGVIQVL